MIKGRNICRVCSSPADYDIFTTIPTYLHAGPNDFVRWRKDISQLLEETTGLKVERMDGLPTKICALCISYLKHAATFRQQAIENIQSLRVSLSVNDDLICNTSEELPGDKRHLSSIDDIVLNSTRETTANNLLKNVHNQTKSDHYKKCLMFQHNNTQSTTQNAASDAEANNLKTYLNLFYDKDLQNSFPETIRTTNYHQDQTVFNTRTDNFKKSKKYDSLYDDNQTGSSDDNEYFERKNPLWERGYFNYTETNFEEDDIMMLDVLREANIIINIPEHFKERKCEACFRRFMFEESYNEHKSVCIEYKFLLYIEEINRLLLIRRKKNISPHEFIRRMIFSLKKTCQWLNKSCCSEIFLPDLLIEKADGRDKTKMECKSSGGENSSYCKSDDNKPNSILADFSNNPIIPFIDTLSTSTNTTAKEFKTPLINEKNDENPLLDLLKQNSDRATNKALSNETMTNDFINVDTSTPIKKIHFTVRCEPCETMFENVGSLERHNDLYHNSPQNLNKPRKKIEKFNNSSNTKKGSPTNKMIKCKLCDLKFLTIIHLDYHKIKCHANIK